MCANASLEEFYEKFFAGSGVPMTSEAVLVKLLEEIANLKGVG